MVLVTGGTGFLGSYIIKQLVEKGYAVRAIRRNKIVPFWISSTVFDKVEWVKGDILDVVALGDAMEGIDSIIHSAALVSFTVVSNGKSQKSTPKVAAGVDRNMSDRDQFN